MAPASLVFLTDCFVFLLRQNPPTGENEDPAHPMDDRYDPEDLPTVTVVRPSPCACDAFRNMPYTSAAEVMAAIQALQEQLRVARSAPQVWHHGEPATEQFE